MKTEIILLFLLVLALIFVLFANDLVSFDIEARVNSESASLFLSGSIIIVAGILSRKRLLRK